MKNISLIVIVILLFGCLTNNDNITEQYSLQTEIESRLSQLKNLMREAEKQGLDIKRELSTVWFAEFYMKCADWDEDNYEINKKLFSRYHAYKDRADELANNIADIQRYKIIDMLDISITELNDVISGRVRRKPVPEIDYSKAEITGDNFTYNSRVIFPFDYTWKPKPQLLNDYAGQMDISLLVLNLYDSKGNIDKMKVKKQLAKKDSVAGPFNIFHKAISPSLLQTYPELTIGKSIFTSYDIDHPAIRDAWKDHFDAVIPQVSGTNFTKYGYNLSNEPHWMSKAGTWWTNGGKEGTVSGYTMQKFHKWLEIKHNNIDNLNVIWGTDYDRFSNIDITFPATSEIYTNQNLWYDWCRFNMDRGTEWLTFLHDEILERDPLAKTHIKVMPNLWTEFERDSGINFEALMELSEILGDDAQIRKRKQNSTNPEPWEDRYAYYWAEMAMSYDFQASISPDKAHINSENHFLSTSHFRDLDMSTEYVRSVFWLAAIHGLDANYIWFWCRDVDGSILPKISKGKGNPGYAGSIAQQPAVANEVSRTMMELNANANEIVKFQRERKPLRLYYSETTAINNKHYMENIFTQYESLYFKGLSLGFTTENILKKQPIKNWDTVLVTNTPYVLGSEIKTLQLYLDNGGTVIIDDSSLLYNEYGQIIEQTLTASNGTLIKTSNDTEKISKLAIETLPADSLNPITLEIESGENKSCVYRTVRDGEAYIINIQNLGIYSEKIRLETGDRDTITNILTGELLEDEFYIDPEEVLFLRVSK